MQITDTALPEVKILTPKRFGDARGYFAETFSTRTIETAGIFHPFVQDNVSMSAAKGTIRGLHFQGPPSAQTKLVTCLVGAIVDVAVDLRVGSPRYGHHVAIELSAENGRQLLVPRGFAHGFCTLVDGTLVTYKVDAFYDAAADFSLAFDDPALGIDWPVTRDQAILSDKDSRAPRLADLPGIFSFG